MFRARSCRQCTNTNLARKTGADHRTDLLRSNRRRGLRHDHRHQRLQEARTAVEVAETLAAAEGSLVEVVEGSLRHLADIRCHHSTESLFAPRFCFSLRGLGRRSWSRSSSGQQFLEIHAIRKTFSAALGRIDFEARE